MSVFAFRSSRISGSTLRRNALATAFTIAVLLTLTLTYLYYARPDRAAAVTVFPPWVWVTPQVLIAALLVRWAPWPGPAALALCWLVFLGLHTDEVHGMLHKSPWPDPVWQVAKGQNRAIRLISLNTRMGSQQAAGALAQYQPDIVFLQESPGPAFLDQLTRELFGARGTRWTVGDLTILTRGRLEKLKMPEDDFVRAQPARITLDEYELQLVNVHFSPPFFRADLLSRECWELQYLNRTRHRAEAEMVARHLETLSRDLPIIVAGDWNVPANDAIFRELPAYMRDAYRRAGNGWGNTWCNGSMPSFLRIDQCWVNPACDVRALVAKRAPATDHYMLICDIVLDPEVKPEFIPPLPVEGEPTPEKEESVDAVPEGEEPAASDAEAITPDMAPAPEGLPPL